MIAILAELIREEIDDLPFVERTAGLVRSLPITVPSEEGVTVKNMPIAINNKTPCEQEEMMYLVPDSGVMSIVFFEDGGTSIERVDSRYIHCRSTLTMVAWFNLKAINADYEDATLLMAHLVSAVPNKLDNTDFITRIQVMSTGELPKDSVYSAYDLSLEENMYFAFPYDYAAFEFDIVYGVAKNCLDDVIINPDVCST